MSTRKTIHCTYWFESSSGSGTYETLQYTDGTTSCVCPGWTRRVDGAGNRSCKHTRMVEAGIGKQRAAQFKETGTGVTPIQPTTTSQPMTLPLGQRKLILK